MSNVKRLIDFEDGNLSEADEIEMFQKLINSGDVWTMQGSYGRHAMNLLKAGKCELATIPFKDAYGNRIPSRYEVQPGTTGAPLGTR